MTMSLCVIQHERSLLTFKAICITSRKLELYCINQFEPIDNWINDFKTGLKFVGKLITNHVFKLCYEDDDDNDDDNDNSSPF